MDRSALWGTSLVLSASILTCHSVAFAQEPAPADAAPAAEAPAAPPEPAAPAPAEATPAAEPAPAVEAEAAPAAMEVPPPDPAAGKPKPPPYSLPWQLRPAVAASVVRLDTTFAFYEGVNGTTNEATGESGSTVASMLLFSYKVTDELAPLIRLGLVSNSPPNGVLAGTPPAQVDSAVGFLNPVLGATFAIKPAKPLRLAFFLGLTLPVGSGGGDDAKPEATTANGARIRARSAMDNAMFLVNDFAIFPGVDLAYVAGGFTAQVEATLFQLTRVKGDADPEGPALPKNPDSSKTNFTAGLHVGYFFIPMLSLGAELRHQRFLSTPKGVELDEAKADDLQQGLRDTTTFAVGPRLHFKLGESVWFRPGVAFSMPLDDPMMTAKYKVFQLDLPVAF